MGTGSGGKEGLSQGPFSFGPSQFDLQSVLNATSGNEQTTTNRYDQLGLGGSTMEGQDLAQQSLAGQAAQGQLQTAQVGQPAFNPALQTPTTNQQGTVIGEGVGAAAQAGAKLFTSGS